MSEPLGVIRRYYDACNSGDLAEFEATLHPEVVHYFLRPNVGSAAVGPRDVLIAYWRKVQPMIKGVWVVDRIVSEGSGAVIEWSLFWNPARGTKRVVTRGAEWFEFSDGLIIEIRSYYQQLASDTELDDYPYGSRGYSVHGAESSSIHTTNGVNA
jgi:ketosteroid isomerase-like protein